MRTSLPWRAFSALLSLSSSGKSGRVVLAVGVTLSVQVGALCIYLLLVAMFHGVTIGLANVLVGVIMFISGIAGLRAGFGAFRLGVVTICLIPVLAPGVAYIYRGGTLGVAILSAALMLTLGVAKGRNIAKALEMPSDSRRTATTREGIAVVLLVVELGVAVLMISCA